MVSHIENALDHNFYFGENRGYTIFNCAHIVETETRWQTDRQTDIEHWSTRNLVVKEAATNYLSQRYNVLTTLNFI